MINGLELLTIVLVSVTTVHKPHYPSYPYATSRHPRLAGDLIPSTPPPQALMSRMPMAWRHKDTQKYRYRILILLDFPGQITRLAI